MTWRGGTGVNVKFQQNLNHYNPGHPGFMDIAWAEGSNPSDSDFKVVSRVNDWWSHSQADQTNFTVHANVPNIDCDHCVLRVRYVPNKPTEPVFHNCADVSIKKTSIPSSLFQNQMIGFYQPRGREFDSRNKVVQIQPDGSVFDVSSSFILRGTAQPSSRAASSWASDDNNLVLANGLMTVSPDGKSIYAIADTSKSVQQEDQPLRQIVEYDLVRRQFPSPKNLTGLPHGMQVTSMFQMDRSLMIVGLQKDGSGFKFSIHPVDPSSGRVSSSVANTKSDSTFVNFLWATSYSDHSNSKVYLLVGDENAPFSLRARLYTLDVDTGAVSTSIPNYNKFTLSAVHADPNTGTLYGLSPGLFTAKEYQWTLVKVDPKSGNVAAIGPIGGALPKGEMPAAYYGGNVYGDAITNDGYLVHVFHRKDGSAALGSVDLRSGKWNFITDIDQGINKANELVSVIRVN
eukprot:gb/GECH01003366.1/.p1 GENE.gb/GECH01003366.1/~~gb/GECH01003366.1/.p1  ORF type:complete len:458 (+),score=112.03 gb/GECH01003366.1/:1-1374(+)